MKFSFKIFSVFLLSVFTFFSCETNQEIAINSDNLLLGNWIEPIYNGEETTFKRGNSLPSEAYGISFKISGNFTERTSGWCGTPPLTFFKINGTFSLNEPLIDITSESYPTNYTWRIVSLTENELIVKRELTSQEKDHRALMDLFYEIQNLAYSVSCSDANDWLFTAYGAKACGGPQGYIPYSNKIDTVAFLQKIEAYTQAEKEYNFNHGVASTCDIPAIPKSVVCENGYPTLKY